MTREEQRFAIAEACGWRRLAFDLNGNLWGVEPKGPIYPNPPKLSPPDYPNDLNAMHEAEKSAKFLEEDYLRWLRDIVRRDSPNRIGDSRDHATFATSAQRSEAFCRTSWPEKFTKGS